MARTKRDGIDRAVRGGAGVIPHDSEKRAAVIVDIIVVGIAASLATLLQTRLMDVAGKAQALAAALNHSAFNIANAIGPWLGGLAIQAGFG